MATKKNSNNNSSNNSNNNTIISRSDSKHAYGTHCQVDDRDIIYINIKL